MDRTTTWVWAVLVVIAGCSAEIDDGEETVRYEGPGDSIAIDETKLDAATDARARAEGLTVWIDLAIDGHVEGGVARFVIAGRASRDVLEVSGEMGVSRVVSARRFEIELDADEMEHVAMGAPLRVALRALRAPHARYVVRLRARARIGAGSGAREVRIASALAPVLIDDEVRYRGAIALDEGLTDPRMIVPIHGEIALDGALRFDLPFDVVARAASERSERLVIVARRRAGTVRRTAEIELVVSELAITHHDPDAVWPDDTCEPGVLACLDARGGLAGDTSSCGDAWRVTRCREEVGAPSLAARFAEDLGAHLVEWYAVHGADVRAAGGASLEDAQRAIEASRVEELVHAAEDPQGHDLATTRVLRHRDVVFPGSDIVWHGAYGRESEDLLEIYAFE
ncbi:hypothetical protein [Sandaracinus amylolyticus]|uniref:hypothetical protein n=1 Tax=Sandaracinus amylolyticus TaxID=927083 RepID=UPI001F388386|nr:hypothetical protein [Sandaracinus amylolyticus]UJR80638.1 Hypothetical protein I5071_26870 [Sandaracinus amylolyticus]